jgi:NAD(P)H dehydrogenase (quinone)
LHVYIVYAHPSGKSFTHKVLEAFTRGLAEAGHTYEIGDLYAMDFKPHMDVEQYERETALDESVPPPADVLEEQGKIARAAALAFVYPLWWSDCPAMLKGWFDRVWAYGYAYRYGPEGEHAASSIRVEKALVICVAGHDPAYLEEIGVAESMRKIFVNDRLLGVGVKEARMEILGGQVWNREDLHRRNLETAYRLGREF